MEAMVTLTRSPYNSGRYAVGDVELSSGARIEIEIGHHLISGCVEFDNDLQRYVAWIGPVVVLLQEGMRVKKIR